MKLRTFSRILIAAIIATSLVIAAIYGLNPRASAAPPVQGTPTDYIAPPISLVNQNGRKVTLGGQRGHVVILTFFYTHCPDTCPLTSQKIRTVMQQMGTESRDVRVLIVSTDPFGDTALNARQFLRRNGQKDWDYLLGSYTKLRKVWREYGIAVALPQQGGHPSYFHQAFTYVIDQSGKARVNFPDADLSATSIALDLHVLLDDHKWASSEVVAPTVGSTAPNFALPGLGRRDVSLNAYRGKAVLVNFWYTNCPPCKTEMPLLERTYQRFKKKLVVIGVDQQEPAYEVAAWTRSRDITYPIALDKNGDVAYDYEIPGTPDSFFVDPSGVIRRVVIGDLSPSLLTKQVASLIRE